MTLGAGGEVEDKRRSSCLCVLALTEAGFVDVLWSVILVLYRQYKCKNPKKEASNEHGHYRLQVAMRLDNLHVI
jgi:hypothetical protein